MSVRKVAVAVSHWAFTVVLGVSLQPDKDTNVSSSLALVRMGGDGATVLFVLLNRNRAIIF